MKEGYKMTEIGEIPVDWEVAKLGEVTKSYAGGTPPRNKPEYYKLGTIPWVKSGEVNQRVIYSTEEKITEKAVRESSARIINPNSILVALYGATAGNIGKLMVQASSNQAVLAVNSITSNLINDYIYHYLKLASQQLLTLTQGSGQPNLSKSLIDGLSIPLPPLPEQQKIAAILSTVDEKIEVIEAQIAQTQQLKKGLMQKLLTEGIGHTRFKDSALGKIPESWEVRRLDQLSNVVRGGSPRPAGSHLLFNGDFLPWVTVAEITNNPSIYLTETKTKLTELGATQTRILQPDTVILANSGATLGVPKILKIVAGANDGVAAFLSLERVAKLFLYYFLESKIRYFREQLAPGSGQPNLNTSLIGGVLLALPQINEQQQISEILFTTDEKLKVLQSKKGHFQQLKKGLMQQLLTGKVRVLQSEAGVLL